MTQRHCTCALRWVHSALPDTSIPFYNGCCHHSESNNQKMTDMHIPPHNSHRSGSFSLPARHISSRSRHSKSKDHTPCPIDTTLYRSVSRSRRHTPDILRRQDTQQKVQRPQVCNIDLSAKNIETAHDTLPCHHIFRHMFHYYRHSHAYMDSK